MTMGAKPDEIPIIALVSTMQATQKLLHLSWIGMAQFAALRVSLLICVATDFEASILRQRLRDARSVRIIETGIGPVNAAHAVTLAIAHERPARIVVCGVGGAYPSAGLRVGDIACADVEVYGDLGAQSPAGFLDMQALGFPVVAKPLPLFNELPMQIFPMAQRVRFVTVSTCTGTNVAAREIELRTGGAIENMEGAAVAHVAHLHDIPAGEVRAISNLITDRDTRTWRLKEAANAAQEAVLAWISRDLAL